MVFGIGRIKKLLKLYKPQYKIEDFGKIGPHTIVKQNSQLVPSNMYLDDYVIIQDGNNFISHTGKLIVKRYSVISSGCIIVPGTHKLKVGVPFYLAAQNHIGDIDYDIVIDEDCWIGAGSILLPNIHIGRGTVVGAGAVVTKDTLPYSVVAGVPAKVIGVKFDLQSCIEHEKCLYASTERLEVSYLEKLYKEKYSDLSTIGDNILDNSEKERVDTFLKNARINNE